MQAEHADSVSTAVAATPRCRNCMAPLTGQYCWRCGQRATSRIISLRRLLGELLGDLFELDSRIWRSLIPLLWRPGHLTNEYLAGRQVRYVPPFRLYVVLSLAFFFFTSFDEGSVVILSEADRQEIEAELSNELAAAGVVDPDTVVQVSGLCETQLNVTLFGREVNPEMLAERCRAVMQDPRAFGSAIVDNLPLALFLALPLLALAAKILYLGSGRYYVEHLLFFTHFHSFCFLLGLLVLAVGALDTAMIPGQFIGDTLAAFSVLYVMGYLLLALHAVYRTSRLGTLARYVLLLQAYLAFLVLGLVGTVMWTIVTL